ncbi:hypothetical protein M23134_00955 [Microscilla marina ATCC 23134]|uniref:Uncharacterized protein n=1 Tax=Microscilla marina ATCC 23134 TaxID=313606 RepID=A1ZZN2_MICM2|nr:hypothetical protein M23134_00955 [Microscilla marina ATCC 23134]
MLVSHPREEQDNHHINKTTLYFHNAPTALAKTGQPKF